MMQLRAGERLRIYTGEQAKLAHRPLYEAIVHEAMQQGMAGATVFKGVLSYGHDQKLHTAKLIEFGVNLPMVVELVDTPEKIESFVPVVESMLSESGAQALVTREETAVAFIP
ncbi:DUF190 domain-containing protein [Chlorobium sp.]|jgi:PII-like signaling protein|uniref:DUF190 domain-containing protein n=1 Tax=Chlorobium sp. TaxID=1095 RepID=UPI003C63C186|nr:DUF190 domain-containing protein [Chlorobiaceae bacterium]